MDTNVQNIAYLGKIMSLYVISNTWADMKKALLIKKKHEQNLHVSQKPCEKLLFRRRIKNPVKHLRWSVLRK